MRSSSAVPEHPRSDRVTVGKFQMRLSDLCIGAGVCVPVNACPCVCGLKRRGLLPLLPEEMVSALRMRTDTVQQRDSATLRLTGEASCHKQKPLLSLLQHACACACPVARECTLVLLKTDNNLRCKWGKCVTLTLTPTLTLTQP